MTTHTAPAPRPGSAEEGRTIERAALKVFARDGCTRAGLGTVAAEAGVSESTLLTHFRDRDQLLLSVVLASAAAVAGALSAVAERHLTDVTDLEADLVAFGLAWQQPLLDFPDHFRLVRQIGAEIDRLPAQVIEVWRNVGPQQAQHVLAHHLCQLAERGLLDVEDAGRAAGRFILLVASPVAHRSFHGALPLTDEESHEIVADGVRDFLRLYRPVVGG
ncbi:TetR/AcrR family transcriptional regulator C-terminal domain-containing protein [Streptomyces sp. SYSU K21746]